MLEAALRWARARSLPAKALGGSLAVALAVVLVDLGSNGSFLTQYLLAVTFAAAAVTAAAVLGTGARLFRELLL